MRIIIVYVLRACERPVSILYYSLSISHKISLIVLYYIYYFQRFNFLALQNIYGIFRFFFYELYINHYFFI